jgi:hypothetical protein
MQGIGGALFEEAAYDENGRFLTPTLFDYLIPTMMDGPGGGTWRGEASARLHLGPQRCQAGAAVPRYSN